MRTDHGYVIKIEPDLDPIGNAREMNVAAKVWNLPSLNNRLAARTKIRTESGYALVVPARLC
jgi:hypothetical protein